jgi:hypothetical protein
MIDPNRVQTMIQECLSGSKDVGIPVEGVMATYVLLPEKLAQHRAEIVSMLEQLPEEFFTDGGGGWSFLNLCQTADGDLWTGMHQTVDVLCVLAFGLDLGKWLMPRPIWSALPGGLPYVAFDRPKFHETAAA